MLRKVSADTWTRYADDLAALLRMIHAGQQREARGELAKRAAVAVAHSILIVVYHLLAKPEAVYTELGADYFVQRDVEKVKRQSVQRLEKLGFVVQLTPAPGGASAPAPS